MTSPILSYKPTGVGVRVDLERLIWSKLLIQAGSGYGKSWAVRQLCEETFGRIPQLVIDPEGEFHTLREKFDYVLAAPRGGDVEATPKTAAILARRLVELSASAVIDLSELKIGEQRRFIRIFLETMLALPRELWHPTLVILDEMQIPAPEKGHGESEALDAVGDFGARSRKRGFCLVGATQRLSKLNKDVAASLHNKLIGFASLDLDIDRSAKELGFDKEKRATINQLDPGQFYAYGPAISKEVTLVRTGDVKTTHPKAGTTVAVSAFPASSKVKALISSSLADLPKEAEEEARTLEELKRQNAELARQLRAAQKAQPAPRIIEKAGPPVIDQRAIDRSVAAAVKPYGDRLLTIKRAVSKVVVAGRSFVDMLGGLESINFDVEAPTNGNGNGNGHPAPSATITPVRAPIRSIPATKPAPRATNAVSGDTTIGKGETIVLRAVASYPDGVERDQLSVLTGYKRSSRDTYIQRLQSAGLVVVNGPTIQATEEGIDALGPDFEPLPTGEALQRYWLDRLSGGERAILEIVITAGGESVSRDAISEATGYKRSSRDTYLQRLSARKLVESVGRGDVRASATLFEEG